MRLATVKLGLSQAFEDVLDGRRRQVVQVCPAAAVVPNDSGPNQIFAEDPWTADD